VIVVDTSVWIAATREPGGTVSTILDGLIDADEACVALPVRLELLSGLGRRDRAVLRKGLTGIPIAVPTEATWAIVERWIDSAADAGQRFGVMDLLIAAVAHELGGLVWSLDKDFERMAALDFVQVY
jgi:predicted nucleic acid-binding protein